MAAGCPPGSPNHRRQIIEGRRLEVPVGVLSAISNVPEPCDPFEK